MTLTTPHRFVITCAPGLEKLLHEECTEILGERASCELEESQIVSVQGDWSAACEILVHSRLASKVLLSLRDFASKNAAMLYDQVRRINWPDYFSPAQTIAVYAHGELRETDMSPSFAPLKIKDALCDEFRKRGFERPSVDRVAPDVVLEAFFYKGRCELSLDLAGAPLHRRGYRSAKSHAPLRENRAAALLRFGGYTNTKPFVDPFCGSGTIAIEAALMALGRAPGLFHAADEFSIYRLFPETRLPFEEAREAAKAKRLTKLDAPLMASDVSAEAVEVTRLNAARAGVERHLTLQVRDARKLEAPDSMIFCNPPFGERLGEKEDAVQLLGEFTRQAKHACIGSTLTLALARGPLEKAVGFKPKRKTPVENAEIPLIFAHYELYAGSSKRG